MDQKRQMTALERIESMGNVLDKLADMPEGGRIKCGYIWIMNDLLNGLQSDILEMQKKIPASDTEKEEPEIHFQIVGAEKPQEEPVE